MRTARPCGPRITLTALKAADGVLLGFAKITHDLSARHAAEATLALATNALEIEAAHGERKDMMAEITVLKEELAVLNRELRGSNAPGEPPDAERGGAPPSRRRSSGDDEQPDAPAEFVVDGREIGRCPPRPVVHPECDAVSARRPGEGDHPVPGRAAG